MENVKALGEEVATLKTKAAMSMDMASRSEAMIKELWERFPDCGSHELIINSKLEALQARLVTCEKASSGSRLEDVKKALEGQQAHETKHNSLASRLDVLECKVAGFMESHDKQKQMLELQNTSHSEMASQVRAQAAHHAALAQRMSNAEGLVTEASHKHSQEIGALQKLLDQLQSQASAEGTHRKSTSSSLEELRQTMAHAEGQQTAQLAAFNSRCKVLEDRIKEVRALEGNNFVNSLQELQTTIQSLREERDTSFRSAEQRFGHLEQSLTSVASEQSFQIQKIQRSFGEMQQQVAAELNSRVAHHATIEGRLSRVESGLRGSHGPEGLEAVLKSIQVT